MFKKISLFVGSLLFITIANAQTRDNITWSSITLQKQLNDRTGIAITPIARNNNHLSSYQNSSIDVSIKRKLTDNWSVKLISRTWFIPENTDWQFIWFDVAYTTKF